ncbi:hypothetical protein N643_20360 [Salmonella bongori serovar 48:z41:-- str. RKS3044]|nr:hypothetical protein N643_20360 [Salmonella bongori serovar 48:z41:-- str. RKS3044]
MDSLFIDITESLNNIFNNTASTTGNPRYIWTLNYIIPIFMPTTHTIFAKRLMYGADKIHRIINSKKNEQAGIMFLFWKRTCEDSWRCGCSVCEANSPQ